MSGEIPTMQAVLDSIESTVEAATRSYVIRVTAERDRLIALGMSEEAATTLMLDSIGTLTGPFAGGISIGQAAAQAANAAQHNAYLNAVARELGGNVADQPMEWVLDPAADHCDDCVGRDGEVMNYSDWTNIGLPGAGGTQCGANCRCTLVPANK